MKVGIKLIQVGSYLNALDHYNSEGNVKWRIFISV